MRRSRERSRPSAAGKGGAPSGRPWHTLASEEVLASNRALLGAVVLTCALQLATRYVPALHPIFKTEPLSAVELVSCLAVSAIVPLAVEVEKALVRRGLLYRERHRVAR